MGNRIRIEIPHEKLKEFCKKWKICEFSLFGSVLRDDFSPDSDVDVLVGFAPDADWSLFDHVRMEEELGTIIGRKAHIVTRRAMERSENWIRRRTILGGIVPYYVER